MKNNINLNVDTYYLGHPDSKINTLYESAMMFNRTKGQLMYGAEDIIKNQLENYRTAHHIMKASKYARGWGLDYPLELMERVVTECNGYLPLSIEGLKSGMWAPKNTPIYQVTNTVPGFGPLAVWLESMLMMSWFASACLTRAYDMAQYLKRQNSPITRIHDFSMRSRRNMEEVYTAGTAWFLGGLRSTDTLPIAQFIQVEDAGSIPALAHNVVQNFGVENEYQAYTHFIKTQQSKGYKVMAIVIDTYSTDNFIKSYLPVLMEIANDENITLIFRPDSGEVFNYGLQIYEEAKKQDCLHCVKVLIGEGVTFEKIKQWDIELELNDIPLDFIAYGTGKGWTEDLSRDTHGLAMKSGHVVGGNKFGKTYERYLNVMKFSDTPMKMSIPGPVTVHYNNDMKMTVSLKSEHQDHESLYTELYRYEKSWYEPEIVKTNLMDIMRIVEEQDTSQQEILYSEKLLGLKEQLISNWKAKIN